VPTGLAFVNAKDEFGRGGPLEKGSESDRVCKFARSLPCIWILRRCLAPTTVFRSAQLFVVLGWEF